MFSCPRQYNAAASTISISILFSKAVPATLVLHLQAPTPPPAPPTPPPKVVALGKYNGAKSVAMPPYSVSSEVTVTTAAAFNLHLETSGYWGKYTFDCA